MKVIGSVGMSSNFFLTFHIADLLRLFQNYSGEVVWL